MNIKEQFNIIAKEYDSNRRKLDRECSVEEELEMLRESKFKAVKCVYSYQKFSVIVAVK